MEFNSGVYCIQNNANGKCYIGSSFRISNRWKEHVRELNNRKHGNPVLQRAWNKYGEDCFSFFVLLFCSPTDCVFYEQRVLHWGHYNICKNAYSTLGTTRTEETKRKISESQKGKEISMEMRKRISNTIRSKALPPWNKGMKMELPVWNKGIKTGKPAWNTGKKTKKKTILLLSESHKGKTLPEEQKEKISVSMKKYVEERGHWLVGYNHTEETKEKIALGQKGRKRSEETKRRMSEAKRLYWEEWRNLQPVRRR